jgi:hypothetical protein
LNNFEIIIFQGNFWPHPYQSMLVSMARLSSV